MKKPLELTIDDLGAQGDGVAHHDGKTFFVSGALPGERVRVETADLAANNRRLAPMEILTASPERIAPPCPHFPQCGGCRLQHMDPAGAAAWKIKPLQYFLEKEGLHKTALLPPAVTAPGTRRRARLAAQHRNGAVTLGFNAWRSHHVVDLASCAVLLPALAAFVQALRGKLSRWLPEGHVCDVQITALPDGLDAVFIGGPDLELEEREELALIAGDLGVAQLSWRKWDRSPVEPVAHRRPLHMTFGAATVPFPPGSFLQATETGENALIDFARKAVGQSARVLDLYCGLGGFGLSCGAAKDVCFADLDGPATAALSKAIKDKPNARVLERNLIREPFTAPECDAFDAVIFDPPRGGAKAQAIHLAKSGVPNIVAISCDAASFMRDAKILVNGGYKLKSILPVDQFLWSTHIELAAHFVR